MTGYREVRKRGIFGWLFLLIFIAWNLAMVVLLAAGLFAAGDIVDQTVTSSPFADTAYSEAHRAGAEIGASLGVFAILILWVIGSVILGLPVLMTRGRKSLVPIK